MIEIADSISPTSDFKQAAELVGASMIGDPGLTAILGGDGVRERQTAIRFFEVAFQHMPGELVSIERDGEMLGVLRRNRWPNCQLSREVGRRVGPLLSEVLQDRVSRLGERSRVWARHEPAEAHWHLAPMAVAPAHQGQGLGSKLLSWFCDLADSDELPSYLETSKVENKQLYERFGFTVRSEAEAVGVPHWFMWREPT